MKHKPVSRHVGNRRLLKLADLLIADARKKTGIKFDLGTWGYVDDKNKPVSCGTRACAMGLAALSGAFKRAGLGYRISGSSLIISLERETGEDAAMRLFGIKRGDALSLFVWSDNLSTDVGAEGERAVAKRIRKFVAEHRA